MRARGLLLVCATAACAVHAQDLFEINVYEYEPLQKGSYTYEAHVNYVLQGTRLADQTLLPSYHQLHFSSELTAGFANWFSAGFVLLTAKAPGRGLEYAGWRAVPHFYAPVSWNLPIRLGLVAEVSSQSTGYQSNAKQLEIRPILEKRIGRLDLDLNPVFAHSLGHQTVHEGWVLAPAARISWKMAPILRPSIEYYGEWGPVKRFPRLRDPVHQILPGADWHIGQGITWSFGLGWSNAPASRLVVKSRFEVEFGRR